MSSIVPFDLNTTISLLERAPAVYSQLLSDLAPGWDQVNEGPGTWSAYDIMGHLIHGERTDWIPRAQIILGSAHNKTFTPFDRFAQEQESKGQTLATLLTTFSDLRAQNVQTLRSWELREAQLNLKGTHPELGQVNLRQLLACWASHDLGHIHQLSRVWVKALGPHIGPWKQYSRILQEADQSE